MIDVEGRLETGGLSEFGGHAWCRWPPPSARPHPARPGGPVAQTRRAPDQAAVPAPKMCAVFGGSARLCLRRRPMTAP
jgi:hypothetical protein